MANQEKQVLWNERIEAFLASGLSQRAWCQEQELPLHQLNYWLRKHRTNPEHPSACRWVSMESVRPSSSSVSGISLRVGHISLDIEPGFDQQTLVDVLHSLMALC